MEPGPSYAGDWVTRSIRSQIDAAIAHLHEAELECTVTLAADFQLLRDGRRALESIRLIHTVGGASGD